MNPYPLFTRYEAVRAAAPPDALVLFRMGDFYEAFGEDAAIIAAELDLCLTQRNHAPDGSKIAMCGVPVHTLDRYVARLTELGHRVVVAEQEADS